MCTTLLLNHVFLLKIRNASIISFLLQVTSLDPSVAISANYIDKSNITRVIAELEVTSLSDSRASELLNILKVKKGTIIEKKEAPPSGISLNWEEFKQNH